MEGDNLETLQNTTGKRPPRREIIWNPTGFHGSSLAYICRTYNDLMIHTEIDKDGLQLPFAVGRDSFEYALHGCEGYLREELTLTPDAFRNAVLIYQRPSWYERCGLCGVLLGDLPLTPSVLPPVSGQSGGSYSQPYPQSHSLSPSSSRSSKSFICHICFAELGTKQSLQAHILAQHEHQRFNCPKGCGTTFSYAQALRRHLREHQCPHHPRAPPN
ncbi:hypothetical protein BT96DRAFT_206604 [Gymnopus androsaceus JB14]|uniref:C2H2-type domain-containing protein n=1 Tax=Gymnopus androsaceus JB14 TaxID=1447944 RepID=A0A6A4IDA1_9AGAR|nr:hypothetical protein BT96DRAFT_206604 [Gymnopus androsaceus JB14]